MALPKRALAITAVALSAAIGLAACSSKKSNSGGTTKSCAGKKIGLVEIVPPSVSPAVGEMEKTAKAAAANLGWSIEVAPADGTPAQMSQVIQTQVTKGVDAILNVAIQPAAATAALQAAKTANIPVIGIGAVFDDPQKLLAATYGPSEVEMSTGLATQMKKDYPKGAQALSLNASAIPSIVARQVTLEKETAGTNIKVAVKHETDLANGPKDTENAVATSLRANPSINMIWALQDFEITTSLKTIQSQGLQQAGIYGYYPPPDAFAAMRAWKSGQAPIVAADSPIKYSPWYAYDSLVNKLCLGKTTDWTVQQSEKPLPVKVFVAGSTNADNQVPTGDYYDWPAFAPYFLDKWKGEGVQVTA